MVKVMYSMPMTVAQIGRRNPSVAYMRIKEREYFGSVIAITGSLATIKYITALLLEAMTSNPTLLVNYDKFYLQAHDLCYRFNESVNSFMGSDDVTTYSGDVSDYGNQLQFVAATQVGQLSCGTHLLANITTHEYIGAYFYFCGVDCPWVYLESELLLLQSFSPNNPVLDILSTDIENYRVGLVGKLFRLGTLSW